MQERPKQLLIRVLLAHSSQPCAKFGSHLAPVAEGGMAGRLKKEKAGHSCLRAPWAARTGTASQEGFGLYIPALIDWTWIVSAFASSTPITITFSPANFSGVCWSLNTYVCLPS